MKKDLYRLLITFILIVVSYSSMAVASSELWDQIHKKYKDQNATLGDVDQLRQQAWESYKNGDYEETEDLLTLSNLIERKITGMRNRKSEVLLQLAYQRRCLTQMQAQKLSFELSSEEFSSNAMIVNIRVMGMKDLIGQFDKFQSPEEYWLLSNAMYTYLEGKNSTLPTTLSNELKVVCDQIMFRYAALPDSKRNPKVTVNQFRTKLCRH